MTRLAPTKPTWTIGRRSVLQSNGRDWSGGLPEGKQLVCNPRQDGGRRVYQEGGDGHIIGTALRKKLHRVGRMCLGQRRGRGHSSRRRRRGWCSGAGGAGVGGGLDHVGRTGLEGAAEVIDAAPQLGNPCLRPNLIGGKLSLQKPELTLLKLRLLQ